VISEISLIPNKVITLSHLKLIKGSREYYIQKIMTTYGYDRENAEKTYEYLKYKRMQYTVGTDFYHYSK
jgi:ABC-type microcin C transport system permease subunit YejB